MSLPTYRPLALVKPSIGKDQDQDGSPHPTTGRVIRDLATHRFISTTRIYWISYLLHVSIGFHIYYT